MPGLCTLAALGTCPKMPRLRVLSPARTTRFLRRVITGTHRHKGNNRRKDALKLVRQSHLNLLRDTQSQLSRSRHRRHYTAGHLGSRHKDSWRRGQTPALSMQKVKQVCQACKPVLPLLNTIPQLFSQANCREPGTRASSRGASSSSSPFQSGRLQKAPIRHSLVHRNQHSCCRGQCQSSRTSVLSRTGLCFPSQLNIFVRESIRPRSQRLVSSLCKAILCN